jgi:hypothetical protein
MFGKCSIYRAYTQSIVITEGDRTVANVEFTLNDIRKVILEDVRQVVREEADASFDRKFKPAFDSAFKPAFDASFKPAFDSAFKPAFDESFKPAFEESFDPYADSIQQDFNRIHDRFNRLESTVESGVRDVQDIKSDLKGIKRIVGQHSKEIIELRARTA